MNSLVLPLTAIVLFAFAYRYYIAFVATKVARVDPSRPTPAVTQADGRDFVKTNKYVLFGHHFAAISASGPLIGPVLAAQFGYLPGALWILFGAALGGAVHDFIILFASVRHGAAPLSEIARREIGPVAHKAATAAILFITILLLAGLAIVVVNALAHSPWGTFTVAMTIPAALLFGLYMYRIRPGRVVEGSLIGVALILLAVFAGPWLVKSQFASWFTFQPKTLALMLPVYGFIAATLPVWLLLCPRDYLSTYMKIGTIVLLVVGVAIVHPKLLMPAVTPYVNGTGPVLPGMKVFPFCFIVIACGAISGFHSLIGSGTTPRMIPNEGSIKFIGAGAMLTEGVVAIMAVSLAVGMAQIFSGLPGMRGLMAYWYHFAIMFEAVFILTALDTGTRVARYLFQDVARHVWAPLGSTTNWVSVSAVGAVVCVAWGYLAVTGSIETIWPLFGVSNQLLAVIALAVGTSFILRQRPAPYALVTLVPLAFLTVSTMTAGVLNTFRYLSPAYVADKGATVAYIDGALSVILIFLVGLVLIDSVRRWGYILAERRRGVVNVPAVARDPDRAGPSPVAEVAG
ncbi:MAG: carbon starvation protein A [Candidatus Eisenbacteria bacterium]|uniref:Carbon starvation protein A n=1 Tax=Eiseniibacteriota bacterium TaxID=2212470 RepID=A0A538S7N3_UNCEI|nr:MAG: carbon starvation protein A [Candidatus Eisenbacteria bacterium]